MSNEVAIRENVAKLADCHKRRTALASRGAREHGGAELVDKLDAEMELAALTLAATFLIDINRIANALSEIALNTQPRS